MASLIPELSVFLGLPLFLFKGSAGDFVSSLSDLSITDGGNAGTLSPAAITAYILAALIAVLLFGLYISHLKRLSIERDANELKCQLAIATQEKCYLIAKIKKPNKLVTTSTANIN